MDESGRVLRFVDAFSENWGVTDGRVWCPIPHSPMGSLMVDTAPTEAAATRQFYGQADNSLATMRRVFTGLRAMLPLDGGFIDGMCDGLNAVFDEDWLPDDAEVRGAHAAASRITHAPDRGCPGSRGKNRAGDRSGHWAEAAGPGASQLRPLPLAASAPYEDGSLDQLPA